MSPDPKVAFLSHHWALWSWPPACLPWSKITGCKEEIKRRASAQTTHTIAAFLFLFSTQLAADKAVSFWVCLDFMRFFPSLSLSMLLPLWLFLSPSFSCLISPVVNYWTAHKVLQSTYTPWVWRNKLQRSLFFQRGKCVHICRRGDFVGIITGNITC